MDTVALQNLFSLKAAQQAKTAELRPGQILNGKIMKLFPNQIAEVQIGSQKVIAKLEAPLSALQRYWFQVQPGEGQLQLKVIGNGTEEGKLPESLAKVLGEFSLPPTKENLELIRFFVKEHLPVTRDMLLQASDWLKSVDSRTAGLEALKTLVTRGLPVTQAAFSGVYAASDGQSLLQLIEQLSRELEGNSQAESAAAVKKVLNDILPANKMAQTGPALNYIASNWLSGDKENSQAAFGLLKHLGAVRPNSSEPMVLQQLLKNIQSSTPVSLPDGARMVKNILELAERGAHEPARQLLSYLSGGKASSVNQILPSLHSAISGSGPTDLQGFKQVLSLAINGDSPGIELPVLLDGKSNWKKAGLALLETFGQQKADKLTSQQTELLAKAVQQAELTLTQPSGTEMLSSARVKGFLAALGLSYESQLTEAFKDTAEGKLQIQDALKPQVLRLLNDNPPPAVREAAEQLLNKLTGFQLLSQEAGPIQQLVVQVPFMMGGKLSEMTMQWSGKKTEDGKIDADFCRVLFYLKLQHLDDTVVDMQVQNRIMSIQIYNENPLLKKFSEQLMPLFKTKLSEIDYHLSSVNFHLPGQAQEGKEKSRLADIYGQREYSGVDIKI
ncbi:hypothetical protein [Mesobacillus subterraneus]|uniref:Flagellar hook-length control protein FliK n=1 Tax=Mesobacillus subterraneus TaxID=285983 RepID=A0A427TUA0_9BACI|nr:hypothetical protein [Mesobacillus subterraneus]RSD28040.1 hypothetical protein EJA10_06135 [Mesobacillus subterraneus]